MADHVTRQSGGSAHHRHSRPQASQHVTTSSQSVPTSGSRSSLDSGRKRKRTSSGAQEPERPSTRASLEPHRPASTPARRRSSHLSEPEKEVKRSASREVPLITPARGRTQPDSPPQRKRARQNSTASTFSSVSSASSSAAPRRLAPSQSDSLLCRPRSGVAAALRSNSSASLLPGLPYYPTTRSRSNSVEQLVSASANVLRPASSPKSSNKQKEKNSQSKKVKHVLSAKVSSKTVASKSASVEKGGKKSTKLDKSKASSGEKSKNRHSKKGRQGKKLDALATVGSCASTHGGGGSTRRAQLGSKQSEAAPSTSTGGADMASGQQDGAGPSRPTDDQPASAGASSLVGVLDAEPGDDADMGRLQALLEARGLPSHLFGALGPRMHQLLHRSMGASVSKAGQLLQGLQASSDEGQQLTAVIEMCQLLVMGNEDTLAGFPVRQVVPALITLLQMEHNFDMMHHACRALTYMMEALPRSAAVVVDAVPAFLEKLQSIQCMDVAEQSLQALEMLSRRHSKAILQAGGISACLMYLDFFSLPAQRAALAVTANCCQNMNSDDFTYIRDSLALLSGKLSQQDKKSVESCCLCFARLVDNFQADERILKEIAAHGLLANSQQLMEAAPALISSATLVMLLRMLVLMCASCPDLAVVLLKQNIGDTLCSLLVGERGSAQAAVELVSRPAPELYEIVSLIGELLPKLPADGIFTVDALLRKQTAGHNMDAVIWQWRDDRAVWHPYTLIDSRIVEAAYQAGDDEVSLATLGRSYTLDFNDMHQMNEDTGTTRPIQRKANPLAAPAPGLVRTDSRVDVLQENTQLAAAFIKTLFGVLYEVYSSSAGPAVRHKCLRALLRMVHHAPAELLREVLAAHQVSSHLAAMMASHDARVVVGAVQMADILMQKLPDVFSVYFRREGVLHELSQLAECGLPEPPARKPSPPCPAGLPSVPAGPPPGPAQPHCSTTADLDSHPHQMRLSDVLKRKKPPKRGACRKGSRSSEEASPDLRGRPAPATRGKLLAGKEGKSGSSGKSSFLASLNPSRWGRAAAAPDRPPLPKVSIEPVLSKAPSPPHANNREQVADWIKQQAAAFRSMYFSSEVGGATHPALCVMTQLCSAVRGLPDTHSDALATIAHILSSSDVSPFEVLHSGLVEALLTYLTTPCPDHRQLRHFLHVFLHLPHPDVTLVHDVELNESTPLSHLTAKLMACFHHLEQYPVRVHDMPSGAASSGGRSSNALRFFNTHQLKCHLQRHPDCKTLRQWKGGPVKIDPLALVQAIERYLVMRGYGRLRGDCEDDVSDDADSDEDIDDTMAAVSISQGTSKHRLQFLIGDSVLPYTMTVYQAVKQFSRTADGSETDTDSEHPYSNAGIWVQSHTIWYRPAPEDESGEAVASPKKTRSEKSSKSTSKVRRSDDTPPPPPPCVLDQFLQYSLPSFVTVRDPSHPVLALLRVIHALSRHWASLYQTASPRPGLTEAEFISCKLTAKAGRQLQDPLLLMTGNLPAWLTQLPPAAPFLLPFDTRQMLFYAVTFDRERAMQRLQDASADPAPQDAADRVAPRLEKRKRVVSRDCVLKQAEKVMDELGSSRAVLEIKYDNEVGTGLGPTLEFYALVSRELQRSDLDLWRGEARLLDSADTDGVLYMFAPCGLFPAPLGRHAKAAHVAKVKVKFTFMGKLMAKAIMDSRMLDISLSVVFYKWLLGEEGSLRRPDLRHIDPDLARQLDRLAHVAMQRARIEADLTHTAESRALALESLTMDGCSVEDLGLDFVLPGYPAIELKRGGKDIALTLDNLDEYIKLVVHWTLVEGVQRQMEALRDGFESVFPLAALNIFYPEECENVVCGWRHEAWSVEQLMECCRPDHGYANDSPALTALFQVLSEYGPQEQRNFLQFVTGSPRLPVGGLKALSPPLTIVKKTFEGAEDPDSFLPSVMTCVNYLKLPDYSSIDVLRTKLDQAARDGQLSFHLS